MIDKLLNPGIQTDPYALVIAVCSLFVSAYIALLLQRLSRKFQQNEATRAINTNWDSFHNAMLNPETHELFWGFVRSDQKIHELGDRAHHIVLMYVNNIHTEYHTYLAGIYRNFDVSYLDTLLRVFTNRREAVVGLARMSGYDEQFLKFVDRRLQSMEDSSL